MTTSEIGVILSVSFFALIFFFISTQASINMCKDLGTEVNETLSDSSWLNNFQSYYDILTFKGCKDIPSWFNLVIIVPISITLVYVSARLIRGGG